MTITELKAKHGERVVNLVVSDIVIAGLGRIASEPSVRQDPLAESCRECFTDINASGWDDIRAIIKRSL